MSTEKTLEQKWTEGYDLDHGGYEFEKPGPELTEALKTAGYEAAESLLIWDGPDVGYCPGGGVVARGEAALLIIAPGCSQGEFPEDFEVEGFRYHRIATGHLEETDHDCDCRGKLVDWTGAAGEPKEPISAETLERWWNENRIAGLPPFDKAGLQPRPGPCCWEFTGNYSDEPHPDCTRCEGEGTLESPEGDYAIYTIHEYDVDSEDEDIESDDKGEQP